ncbi:MAG: DUF177 domain-containing protein [Ruminococcus sp.]|nr:DUF177 domain-containing protein [Ruminococcus sp.]
MVLQLQELFQIDGKKMPICYEIHPDELEYLHGYQFNAPISIKGEIKNRVGIVTLKYSVNCMMHVTCDRCLKLLERTYSYDFKHMVVPVLHGEDDGSDIYFVVEDDRLDMNETAISDLLLMMPTKILCSEDCKGLCDICGCDLNKRTCDCRK